MKKRKGFTLVELMVVILIIGILAAVAVPLMRGRIDKAKWSEANASCGTIWSAVRAYIAEKGPDHDYADITGLLSVQGVREKLGFGPADLAGTYFIQSDYKITAVDGTDTDGPGCTIEAASGGGSDPPRGGPGTFTATAGAVVWSVEEL